MWVKKGLIYKPRNDSWWNVSHAYCPTPFIIGDVIRVYFATWDVKNVGRVTYVDIDKNDPTKILHESDGFVLNRGDPGMFDYDGVAPSYVLSIGDVIIMYYFGFQKTSNVNATLVFAGVAKSLDNGDSFTKVMRTPVLERSPYEADLRSSVSILYEDNKFKVWYTAATSGITKTDNPLFSKAFYPNYSIRYLECDNLLKPLPSTGSICLDLVGDEFALGRPWVIHEGGKYKMWYSRRGVSQLYRFGYAESHDGIKWKRMDDKINIQTSPTGWDSEMVCFPTIVDIENNRYMFYNGNFHGRDGFGLAIWED